MKTLLVRYFRYGLQIATVSLFGTMAAGNAFGSGTNALPPTISTQPWSITNVVGTMASFTGVASGTAPLLYQWQRNGTNLAGASLNPTLTITNVQASDAGTYAVVVSNDSGSVASSNATLTAIVSPPPTAPVITTQPVSQTNTVGTIARFTVVAGGTTPLNYRWRKNGVNLSGASANSTLSITNVQTSNAGIYSVVVSNVAGSITSSNAVLTVSSPPPPATPAITSQPVSCTSTLGNTAAFTVAASGTAPLSYQWRFNGIDLVLGTNATLTLANVQLEQAGAYSVRVSNAQGSTNSADALLVVTPVPPCVTPPSGLVSWWQAEGNAWDQSGGNNGTLQGGASFTAGRVGQAFAFTRTNSYVRIPRASNLDMSSQVTVEFWMKANPGNAMNSYQGLVCGDFYEVEISQGHSARIGVNFGVSTTSGTSFAEVADANGGGAVVSAGQWHHIAGTYDGAKVQLYIDGQPWGNPMYHTGTISPMLAASFMTIGSEDGRTTCPSCIGSRYFNGLIDEVGIYRRALSGAEVQAIYNTGSAGKCPAASVPTIITQPVAQSVTLGEMVSFSVVAGGTQPMSFQWKLNGTDLAAATNNTLTLVNVQFEQAGTYSVQVSNAYGSTNSAEAVLAVTPVPPCAPPVANLVSWWAGEGNAWDNAGGNNGMVQGGVSFGAGKVGQAFVCDGIDAAVKVAASSNLDVGTGGGLTIEGWINPDDVSRRGPLAEWNNGNGSWGTHFHIDPFSFGVGPGALYANLTENGVWHQIISPAGVVVSHVFQHVALTYDKSTGVATIYRNGAVVAQRNLGVFRPQTAYDLYLGRRPSSTPGDVYSFAGSMDEMSIYNRALSASEIQAIYQAGSAGKCATDGAPVIFMEPSDQTATIGDTAAFSVQAGGAPPLSYQWQVNGTDIDGGTNATLLLVNVQSGQAGAYSARVSNTFGSTNSVEAVLTVTAVPPCVAPPSGLVSWWQAEGNASDNTGGNDGLLLGDVNFVPGKVGQAFVFDGVESGVKVVASPSLDVGAAGGLTIEGWINPDDVSRRGPLAEWNNGNGSWGTHFHIDPFSFGVGPGALYANLTDNGGWHQIISGAGVVVSHVFQHVALTYDKGTGVATLYRNGVVVAQQDLGVFTPQTAYDLYLGRRPSSTPGDVYSFAGSMDEMSIYNRALSASEIQAIYHARSAGKCATPGGPVIFTKPADRTAIVGDTAAFSVLAGGTPPLSYQWQVNGTGIDGGTNAILTLVNVQSGQAGAYSVRVSNAYGSTNSVDAVLTVPAAPPCVAPPSGLVSWWRAEGNALDITGGNNGLFQGGVSFVPGKVGQSFAFNGTNSSVKIPRASNLDMGSQVTVEFWMKANPGNAMNSYQGLVSGDFYETEISQGHSARIGVNFGISTTSGASFAEVADANGGGAVVTADEWHHIAGTYDGAKVLLYIDGQPWGNPMYHSGTISPMLADSFMTIGSEDGRTTCPSCIGTRYFNGLIDEVGIYNRALSGAEVRAIYNAGGAGKCEAASAPVIFAQPLDQTVVGGDTVIFSVAAGGAAVLNYQWSFSGANLDGATNSSLALTNVQLTNAGSYHVRISNNFGAVTSSSAALVVGIAPPLLPPVITGQPADQTVSPGSTVLFGVTPAGTGPFSYQWQFNGTNIAGARAATLRLANLRFAQAGLYRVLVSDRAGTVASADATLSLVSLYMQAGTYAGLTIAGPISSQYRIDCKTESLGTNWMALTAFKLSSSPQIFIDEDSSSSTNRFYRAVLLR